MTEQHDERGDGGWCGEKKEKKEVYMPLDSSPVMVSMVLRDQMRIHSPGAEYKNMRMFTRREGAGVETLRLDIEPWILAAARTEASWSVEPA